MRFSLRGVVALITAVCALLALHMPRVQRQQAAIAQIQRYGGRVYYDFELADGTINENGKSSVPSLLLSTLGHGHFQRIVRVDLTYRELRFISASF